MGGRGEEGREGRETAAKQRQLIGRVESSKGKDDRSDTLV